MSSGRKRRNLPPGSATRVWLCGVSMLLSLVLGALFLAPLTSRRRPLRSRGAGYRRCRPLRPVSAPGLYRLFRIAGGRHRARQMDGGARRRSSSTTPPIWRRSCARDGRHSRRADAGGARLRLSRLSPAAPHHAAAGTDRHGAGDRQSADPADQGLAPSSRSSPFPTSPSPPTTCSPTISSLSNPFSWRRCSTGCCAAGSNGSFAAAKDGPLSCGAAMPKDQQTVPAVELRGVAKLSASTRCWRKSTSAS